MGPELLGGQGEAQQALHLAGCDGEGGRRGEAGYHGDGDEVYQEAKFEKTTGEYDAAGEEGQEYCVLGTVLGVDAGHQSHDGGGADGDIFTAPKDAVNETSHEGGVEPVLRREPSHHGIGDTLGDYSEANCEASDQIRDGRVQVILREPLRHRDSLVEILPVVTTYSSPSPFEPL